MSLQFFTPMTHLVKQNILNVIIGIANNTKLESIPAFISKLCEYYYFHDDAILLLINSIKPYNCAIEHDEIQMKLLLCFDISKNFNNSKSFNDLLDCFKDDKNKIIAFNKKMNETKLIFLNIYESIEHFNSDNYKIMALEKIIEHDTRIIFDNLYLFDLGYSGVAINLQNVLKIIKMFTYRKFSALCMMLNQIKKLLKNEDIKNILLKNKFNMIYEEEINKIIKEISNREHIKLILSTFPSYNINNLKNIGIEQSTKNHVSIQLIATNYHYQVN